MKVLNFLREYGVLLLAVVLLALIIQTCVHDNTEKARYQDLVRYQKNRTSIDSNSHNIDILKTNVDSIKFEMKK